MPIAAFHGHFAKLDSVEVQWVDGSNQAPVTSMELEVLSVATPNGKRNLRIPPQMILSWQLPTGLQRVLCFDQGRPQRLEYSWPSALIYAIKPFSDPSLYLFIKIASLATRLTSLMALEAFA